MNTKQRLLLKFLEASGPGLHGMLTRLTLDETVAEELMQNLFIRLFEIKHLEKIENLHAYACRIAINLAFDRRRQHRSFSEIPDSRPDLRIPRVDRRLIQAEEIAKILDAAQQLSGLTRECFVLRYIEQMEYAEIAKRTQKNPQQVRALCSKGTQRIRQILNEQNASFYKEAINE
ncbi:MAG: sigma-70 family RNA polymerase sigma factor [Phycisphaerae bacterium]|nr:sigma-70 family RNA polymerase sigma factor [Phycisphaerae bacterium]